jgi:hypothetical protein
MLACERRHGGVNSMAFDNASHVSEQRTGELTHQAEYNNKNYVNLGRSKLPLF